MQKGTIVRLMDNGFGFIKSEAHEKDIFFHANEIKNFEFNDLQDGDAVEFELAEGEKGPQATNVNKV
jgi:CspA family cold shock protein